MRRLSYLLALVSIVALTVIACVREEETASGDHNGITREMEDILRDHILQQWYPLIIDSAHGGYLSDFNYKWEQQGPQHKMIVTQARHLWTTALAAEFTGDTSRYLPYARHGYAFLTSRMWDSGYGGFYNLVTREGEVIPEDGQIIKRAYGNAFALYGLSRLYKISGDQTVLDRAKSTFFWLEEQSHDPEFGGYFQFISRQGKPYTEGYQQTPPKDQNSSIHLLEAFTELYAVWPDERVRKRLQEMFHLVRDTMVTDRGYLRLFFRRDWTPVSYRDSSDTVREAHYYFDHVSFGHDVETAYLLLEASQALGGVEDSLTERIAKKMVDHALSTGWDQEKGGFYDRGYYFAGTDTMTIIKDSKAWWSQAEGLNTLLLMGQRYPDDPMHYFRKFREQWNYIQKYLIDRNHGGWYPGGLDQQPAMKQAQKSQIWKGPYHTTRSLVNCIRRLR